MKNNKKKVVIDFAQNYLTDKDFGGREQLEKDLLEAEVQDGYIYLDRLTHSFAIEFFEVLTNTEILLVVQHTGGAS